MLRFFKKQPVEYFLTTEIHSHLLPDLDDGVENWEESLTILKTLSELGITKVVTTPHIMSDYYPNTSEKILEQAGKLNEMLSESGIDIKLEAAAEYYIDEHFLEKIQSSELLTFGENYILVELPFLNKPLIMEETFFQLNSKGYRPILAHPERYVFLQEDFDLVNEILNTNILLQVNINSLSGYYSKGAKKLAERLIDESKVHFLGSDIHNLRHLAVYKKSIQTKYFGKCRQLNLLNNTLSI